MKSQLESVIELIEVELQEMNHYIYLPEILELLKKLSALHERKNIDLKEESRLHGGLIRLVTEDLSFSESNLGVEIVEVLEAIRTILLEK